MKFNFLVAAINDAQEVIKFIETKGTIAIVVLGGIFALLFPDIKNICLSYESFSSSIKVMIWLTIIFLIIAIYSLVRLIMPIGKSYGENITPRFYLKTKSCRLSWIFPFKEEIATQIRDYQDQIFAAEDIDILNSLICELYSVSYIRSVKSKRLTNLLIIMIVSTIIFIFTYLLL